MVDLMAIKLYNELIANLKFLSMIRIERNSMTSSEVKYNSKMLSSAIKSQRKMFSARSVSQWKKVKPLPLLVHLDLVNQPLYSSLRGSMILIREKYSLMAPILKTST